VIDAFSSRLTTGVCGNVWRLLETHEFGYVDAEAASNNIAERRIISFDTIAAQKDSEERAIRLPWSMREPVIDVEGCARGFEVA
jgi:hypothetical protein